MKYNKKQQMLDLGYFPLIVDDFKIKPKAYGFDGKLWENPSIELGIFAST